MLFSTVLHFWQGSKWHLAWLLLLPGILITAYRPSPPPPPPGLTQAQAMGAYLNGKLPSTTPSGGAALSYEIENAFPNLTFIDPLKMLEVPGQNTFMMLGKKGHVWSFANNPAAAQKTLMLDFSAQTITAGDGGALGLVLHPEFGQAGSPNRGYFYIWYRYAPVLQNITGPNPAGGEQYGYMRLSRFNLADGAATVSLSSEYVMIQQFDRNSWHNGGDMFFGPDGFLYIPVGDEGGANDQYNVAQRLDYGLFGGILRIDVDQKGGTISHAIRRQPQNPGTPPAGWPGSFTQGYYIPNDNPWLDVNGGRLEEFWAVGLRSPHRMTRDPQTGEIWIGDIGQGSREEISIAAQGDNLQWPYREGAIAGPKAQPNPLIGASRAPVYDYPRSFGTCVIGGYVYRGTLLSGLTGKYIFGDHTTRNVYALTRNGSNPPTVTQILNVPLGTGQGSKAGISSFALDSQGNMYILKLNGTNLDGGIIYKIKQTGGGAEPPSKLSDLGVFTNMSTLATAPGILPYTVNAPLWSDRADKKRWIALPNDGTFNTAAEKVTFREEDYWSFPKGTVFIKHFDLPVNEGNLSQTKKLETRFFVIGDNGEAYGVTYKWNDAGTEAFLEGPAGSSKAFTIARANGTTYPQTWQFPSREQCMSCHNANAGFALGVRTRQLNGNLTYSTGISSNQLETWNHLGIFDKNIGDPGQYAASAHIGSSTSSNELKVRSYLDANCAFCHRPNGVEGAFDARSLQALFDQNMIHANAISHASPANGKIIAHGQPLNSVLYNRDNSLGADMMPPIAKSIVDQPYISTLSNWINEIPAAAPAQIADGWYRIEMRHSTKSLAIENGGSGYNARVVQQDNSSADGQKWQVQNMGGGKYRLMAAGSNLVMATRDWSPARGSEVVQQTWTGRQNQLWYLQSASSGYHFLINAYSGLAFDIFGGSTAAGTQGVTWTKHSGNNQQLKFYAAPVPACANEETVYLSDLSWTGTPSNGWGPVEKNKSNGEQGANDGNTLTINGQAFAKGLGVHANSRIEYNLGGVYERFRSSIGLDDEVGANGSVRFVVLADGFQLYGSPVMNGNTAAINLDLNVRGTQKLVLIVNDGGDNINSDHANWANARLSRCNGAVDPIGDMIAWWKLQTDAEDAIGNAEGVFQGGAHTGMDDQQGSVGIFGGQGSQVYVAPQPQLNVGLANFSVSYWLKLSEGHNGQWRVLMHKGSTSQQRTFSMWMQPNDNRLHFRISSTGSWNDGGNSVSQIPVGAWTHIAYVKEGNQLKLYINGVLDATDAISGTVVSNNGPLYLGDSPWNLPAASRMNDVRLYGKALTPAEIATIMGRNGARTAPAIEWLSFDAAADAGQVKLDWSLKAEEGIAAYRIEHSYDGRAFSPLGEVGATGATGYSYAHDFAPDGISFYRITAIGQDGSLFASEIRKVSLALEQPVVRVYPNPASASEALWIEYRQPGKQYVRALLSDALGHPLDHVESGSDDSQGLLSIPLHTLAPGIYFLRISAGDWSTAQRIIVR